jgi:hypothetical protein
MVSAIAAPPALELLPRPKGTAPLDAAATWLVAAWPQVRVRDVDAAMTHGCGAPVGIVHACVDLGVLLPLDVVVELVGLDDVRAGSPRGRVLARLWSSHSYQNGGFAFDAMVPAQKLRKPRHLAVRVTPATTIGPAVNVPPVIARFTIVGPGAVAGTNGD